MKTWKKRFGFLIILASVFSLLACVTESVSHGAFKNPSKEDLDRAMSLYVQIAYKNLETKDYERAMVNVKRALDIDNNSPLALNALAVVYQYQGDTEKSRATFKKALSGNDKFSEGHLNYGQFLFQQKEFDSACKQFQMASDDDFYAKRATAFYYWGVCLKAAGDPVRSEEALVRSIGLDSKNTPALFMLANIKFEKQQYSESKALFDQYVQLARDANQQLTAEVLWLGIRLEKVFGNKDAEASWALQLKNNHPYSKEYLEYQNSLKK